MPATYTHAVYGRQVLDQLEPALRERIISHLDCYNIGLHGPDLLFFYKPLSQAPIKNKAMRCTMNRAVRSLNTPAP